MTRREKLDRDAVTRLRAAMLDLTTAQRFTEANDVLDIIERIEPPASAGVSAPGGLTPGARPGRSESAMSPPSSSAPATYNVNGAPDSFTCQNCGVGLSMHCTTHLLPCCPGSLMHGQDEGTWTPAP
jgi:hypothetical protein